MSVLFLTVCYSFLYDIMTWTTWLISKACMRLVAILELMQSGIKIWKLREKSLCVDCSAHTLYLCCTLSFCTRRVMMISTTASAKKRRVELLLSDFVCAFLQLFSESGRHSCRAIDGHLGRQGQTNRQTDHAESAVVAKKRQAGRVYSFFLQALRNNNAELSLTSGEKKNGTASLLFRWFSSTSSLLVSSGFERNAKATRKNKYIGKKDARITGSNTVQKLVLFAAPICTTRDVFILCVSCLRIFSFPRNVCLCVAWRTEQRHNIIDMHIWKKSEVFWPTRYQIYDGLIFHGKKKRTRYLRFAHY